MSLSLKERQFNAVAFLDGREWLAHDSGIQHMVFEMRQAARLLALGRLYRLSSGACVFGESAPLIALGLAYFN